VLKNLLQRVFNFGSQEKGDVKESAFKIKSSQTHQKTHEKHEALSECCSLLRAAQSQKREKLRFEALITLEKIIEIMEREGL